MIQIRLLGTPSVQVNGEPILFHYKKVEGLLYYLCCAKCITRDDAVNLLWGSIDEKSGRRSLRDAIYWLRKTLGDDFLRITGYSKIELNPDVLDQVEIDLDGLDDENYLEKYTGDFLDNFYIKKCLEFEHWQERVRSELKAGYIRVLRNRMDNADDLNGYQLAHYAHELVEYDKYNEETYRFLMQVYARKGRHKAAVNLYRQLEKMLADDLGEQPSKETEIVFEYVQKLSKIQWRGEMAMDYQTEDHTQLLYKMLEIIDEFKHGAASSVLFCGDVGSGKTNLLQCIRQFIENEKNILVLEHNCFKSEMDISLLAWQDMLVQLKRSRSMRTRQSGKNPAYRNEGPEKQLREIMNEFRSAIQQGKIILFIDDIHWMDSSSRTLLSSILLQLEREHIMLLASVSSEFEGEITAFFAPLIERRMMTVKPMVPLSRHEEERIIRKALPNRYADRELVEGILAQSEGNPLFLMETIETVRSGNPIDQLTDRMSSVLSNIYHSLNPEEQEFLNALTLFDSCAGLDKIKICVVRDEMELYMIARKLLSKKLIYEVQQDNRIEYAFVRRSFCNYVYGILPAGEKVAKHYRIASYYEDLYRNGKQKECISKVIHHFKQCGNLQNTYKYQLLYLHDICTLYFETYPRFLGGLSIPTGDRSNDYYQKNIDQLVRTVNQMHGNDRETLELKLLLAFVQGRFELHHGHFLTGEEHMRQALDYARTLRETDSYAHILRVLIMYCAESFNLEMMHVYVDEFAALADGGDKDIHGYALFLKGFYYSQEKKYEEALKLLKNALEYEKIGHDADGYYAMDLANNYSFIGDCYFNMQQYEIALRQYRHAVNLSKRNCLLNCYPIYHTKVGRCLYFLGDIHAAEQELTRALELFRQTGERWWLDVTEAYVARVHLKKGDLPEARRHLARASELVKGDLHPDVLRLISNVSAEIEGALAAD